MDTERSESAINEEALARMLNKTRAFLREEQKKAAAGGPAGFEDEDAADWVLNQLKKMIPGQPGKGEGALFEGAGEAPPEEESKEKSDGGETKDPLTGILG